MGLRRFFQFRLRTLLIVATLLCIALAVVIVPARRHRQAVLKLRQHGIHVSYVYENDLKPKVQWYQKWLGCDFSEPVRRVYIHDTLPTEQEWRWINDCQPQEIQFEEIRPTDRLLKRISSLRSLRFLLIANTALPAGEWSQLNALSKLDSLFLYGVDLTDADLHQLASLRNLEALNLDDTKITPAGIAKLRASLPQCKVKWYVEDEE